MTREDLDAILKAHAEWLINSTKGKRADLTGAVLMDAVLTGADLKGANLRRAVLTGAVLMDAVLTGAVLTGAVLTGADLTDANLTDANLTGAVLMDAVLTGADLRRADLRRADLRRAVLTDATLPGFQIPQEGTLIVWKKTFQALVKLEIPIDAKRTATPIGRKCRAERAKVLEVIAADKSTQVARSIHDPETVYRVGEIITPDSYDPDIRVECTHGIHFFLTREEAEEY